jgi:hypothetical protein
MPTNNKLAKRTNARLQQCIDQMVAHGVEITPGIDAALRNIVQGHILEVYCLERELRELEKSKP